MHRLSRMQLPTIRIRYYIIALAVSWTLVLGGSAFWNIHHEQQGLLEMARMQARVTLEKDIQYRRWNAGNGGVYVPLSAHTPANPYLVEEIRTVETSDGQQLVMVNPAYMTRQVHDAAAQQTGFRGHITSLNPIRSDNAADSWETYALQQFESGSREYSAISDIDGTPYMRLMRPLKTEVPCLTCHAQQGYSLGDIRGGMSVAVPMAPLTAISDSHANTLIWTHLLVWLIGITGLIFGSKKLTGSIQKQEQNARELQQYLAAVEHTSDAILITDGNGKSLFLNFAFGQLFGYTTAQLQTVDVRKLVNVNLEKVFDVVGGLEWETECMGKTVHKTQFPCLIRCSEILDVNFHPIGLIWNFLDISEQKQQERERLENERIKVLIETVGGVCHNINQPLTVLSGYTEILRTRLPADAPQVSLLDKMDAATEKIISITRKLQTISKYETMPYVEGQIIDIDKASESSEPSDE